MLLFWVFSFKMSPVYMMLDQPNTEFLFSSNVFAFAVF